MAFPDTRHTLIQRLATRGEERDWQQFLADYWQPVCQFARRRGNLTREDAEDVAALVFEAVVGNRLLSRWAADRAAKLRTLLCTVARNVLANRARVLAGRERRLRDAERRELWPTADAPDAPAEQVDAFYAAWAEEVLQRAVGALLAEYHGAGKGDYFRVLHGRVCEGMTVPEAAAALDLPTTTAENYYKHARHRLGQKLHDLVCEHVARYCPPDEVAGEAEAEWGRLGEYLTAHGGLEQAVRRATEAADAEPPGAARAAGLGAARDRLATALRQSAPATGD